MLVIKSRFFDLSEMADLVLLANAVHQITNLEQEGAYLGLISAVLTDDLN